MAQITASKNPFRGDESALVITWGPMSSGDTCLPVDFAQWADRSIQIEGTFGGASVVLHGSNSGTGYVALTDMLGGPISFTSSGIKQINEVTCYIKPVIMGGDGTTAITVTVLSTRTQPLYEHAH